MQTRLFLFGAFMEIIELPIKSIIPYKNNPRHNDKAVEFVANSLRQFGWKQPIVIDEKYEIVAGHTRWKAAKMLGMETVPCVMADDLTPEQVQAYRLADNKTAEMADWDFDLLEQELNDIDPAMFDMADFGFFQGGNNEEEKIAEEDRTGNMAEKYLVPPFSVIYANKPDWLSRKRSWVAKGLHSEIGRGGDLLTIQGAIQRQTFYTKPGGETSKSVQEQHPIKQLHEKSKAYSDGLIARRKEIRKMK